MHSFYSSGNQTKTRFRKQPLQQVLKQQTPITEDPNEDAKSVASHTRIVEVTNNDNDDLQEVRANEEAVEQAKMDLQVDIDP